jgi:hypothetical protein
MQSLRAVPNVVSPARVAGECPECEYLLNKYEAVTFEQARAGSAFDIAGYIGDKVSIKRLQLEVDDVAERQRIARAALANHQNLAHPVVFKAGA